MVSRSGTPKGRKGTRRTGPSPSSETPPPPSTPRTRQSPRVSGADRTPGPDRELAFQNLPPGGPPAGGMPGVAQFEALVQAFSLLSADTRRALTAQMGVPSTSSATTQSYDEDKIDGFYLNCIKPFIPVQLQSEIDSVEWAGIGSLSPKACCSLELRKPGEDEKLKDMLHGMWYKHRLDTSFKPQPAHVLELFQKQARGSCSRQGLPGATERPSPRLASARAPSRGAGLKAGPAGLSDSIS